MEQEHTESTQDKKHCMEETVERVKERIIATSKLLGYLQNAKKDLEDKNQQIANLKSTLSVSIKAAQEADNKQKTLQTEKAKQTFELTKKNQELAVLKENLCLAEKKVEVLTADLGRVEREKEALDEDMIEMKMNSDLVENELEDLKESLQNMIPKEELRDMIPKKELQNMIPKKELQDMIPKKELEKRQIEHNTIVSNLKKQIQDLQEQNSLEDDELPRLRSENEQLKSKNVQLKWENEQLKGENSRSKTENSYLNDENLELKAEISQLKVEISNLKIENSQLKSKVSYSNKNTSPKLSSHEVNKELMRRFHKVRGDCNYYRKEMKRLEEELKQSFMRESVRYGLDDMPGSPASVHFEDDSIFESNFPELQPRSLASLANTSSNSPPAPNSMNLISPIDRGASTPSQPSSSPVIVHSSVSKSTRVCKPNPIDTMTGTIGNSRPPSRSIDTAMNPILPNARSQSVEATSPASSTTKSQSIDTAMSPVSSNSGLSSVPIDKAMSITSSKAKQSSQADDTETSTTLSQTRSPSPSTESPANGTEKAQIRKSGLIPPPPKITVTAKAPRKINPTGRNKQSRLMKFVNARNSGKMLNSKPLSVPITPTATLLKTTASTSEVMDTQKPATITSTISTPADKSAASPKATSTEAPETSSEPVREIKRRASQTQLHDPKDKGNAAKKSKPTTTANSKIALMESLLKTGIVPDLKDIVSHPTDFLDEIDEMYSTMNSAAELSNKELTAVGHPNVLQLHLPQGIIQREKMCMLLVCLLAKHYPLEFQELLRGIVSRLIWCVNEKAVNKKLIRYVRLVAVLAKFNNQPELIRSCIYNILKSKNKEYTTIVALLNISYIYKECLSNPTLDGLHDPDKVLFYDTLQACVTHINQLTDTPPNVKTMYDKLIKEIGWNNQIEIDSCIDAAMKLLDSPEFLKIFQDPKRFQQVRQIIVMSIDLCFKIGHTWKYTYDEFIRKKLWPLLPKPVVNDVVIELLGILGSQGVSRNPFKKDELGVDALVEKLVQIVKLAQPMPPDQCFIQHTAARAILVIAGDKPSYKKLVSDFYASRK